MVDLGDSSRAEPEARRFIGFMEISMTCLWLVTPWRATTLAAALALGVATAAFAQATMPTPDGPPPPPAPKAETPAPSKEPFGVDVTLTPKTIIYMKGNGSWDNALETLQDAFKSVYALLDKQGIQRAGPPMTIYTEFDDTTFQFQAAVPIAEAPKDPPKGDMAVGQMPAGKALKFVYRGAFQQMEDTIYNAIPEYLDEKQLESSGTLIEEYETDPVTTPENNFVITIYVLLK
jgi:effector-binding domain-containing protein